MVSCSLVITTYNRSHLLKRAIRSAIGQTLTDIEIIIIDDCSSDDTGVVVESFMQQDSRVIYYKNEQNIGLGMSRNKAINFAKGDFIAFCDDDDWISENYLQSMYDSCIKYNADIAKSAMIAVHNDRAEILDLSKKSLGIYETLEERMNLLWFGSINTLYKRDFLLVNDIKFSDFYYEDYVVAYKVHFLANKIVYFSDNAFYYYDLRGKNSMTRNSSYDYTMKRFNGAVRVMNTLNNFFSENNYVLSNNKKLSSLYNITLSQADRFLGTYKNLNVKANQELTTNTKISGLYIYKLIKTKAPTLTKLCIYIFLLSIFKFKKLATSDKTKITMSFFRIRILQLRYNSVNKLERLTILYIPILNKTVLNKKAPIIFDIKVAHSILSSRNLNVDLDNIWKNNKIVLYANIFFTIDAFFSSRSPIYLMYNPEQLIAKELKNYLFVSFGSSGLLRLENLLPQILDNNSIVLCEDGFLRSIHLYYQQGKIDDCYVKPLSFIFDDLGFHFSCHYPTRIELLLNNSPDLNEKQKLRAITNINYIVGNYLTKYNYKPIRLDFELPGHNKKKILVIGQKINDASVTNSNVPENIFQVILEAALIENPEADIIFVDHPETKKHKLSNGIKDFVHDNLHIIGAEINIPVLLEKVDKVYVCSSGVGLEAIIRKKEVVVFGAPFYAGWGLTDDRNEIFNSKEMKQRRSKKLTIEELFYRAYIDYTVYRLPGELAFCSIERALEYLLNLREEYFVSIAKMLS